MLYMICSCGEILGNKQLVYEQEIKKICNDLNIDYNMISQGLAGKVESEFKNRRKEIVTKLCRRICCRIALLNYIDLVQFIKG